MEFKIDTKDTFSTIRPITELINANLAVELAEMCGNMRQSGSHNFIVDFQDCNAMEENAVETLIILHEDSYGQEQSLVFTGVNDEIIAVLKKAEADVLLNIAPKMIEAIDIVSMEILERELLGEE